MELMHTHEIMRKPIASLAIFGGIALGLSGCATGSYEVLPAKPVEVLDKQESSRFVSAQESPGYPHYEKVYTLTIEQCGRSEEPIADNDGCIELGVKVSETTFDKYNVGDSFSFNETQRGYLPKNSR